ncbi:hypothetical protein, partial [Gardnerella sp. KA00735]|uniref:hypothetical protein n=1 Tax=Gardnerella sp. KA00735 TaxID=1973156 RepID=UPI001E2C562F
MNLNTLFNGDSPIKFDGIKDPVKNFSNISYGNIDMYQATANCEVGISLSSTPDASFKTSRAIS